MGMVLARIRAALVRRIRYQVTRGGAVYFLALALVAAAAVISANNLLFLILAAMVATLLISGFVNRLCLAGLELDFLVPEHVSAGRTVRARLFVRNAKKWMPSFSMEVTGLAPSPLLTSVYFPVIPGGATLEEGVEIRFPRRGAYRQNRFAFSTRFPFGFLEKNVRVTLRREVIVYPSIDPQPGFEDLLSQLGGEIESHQRGLGRDFYRIRPYQPFESARHVDWKATAHVGSLQVREFAREQEQSVEMYLDRNVPPEMEAWFEQAVACCAFLCWRLSARGAGVHFRTQDLDIRLPEECDIYAILKILALIEPAAEKSPEAPLDYTRFHVVLSHTPQVFRDAGWTGARILTPDEFLTPARVNAGD